MMTGREAIVPPLRILFAGANPGWAMSQAVEEIGSGQGALRRIARKKFDCLVCDRDLPDLAFDELLTRARRTRPNLPILVLLPKEDPDFAARAMSLGATAVRVRPSQGDAVRFLVAAARQTMRRVGPGLERVGRRLGEVGRDTRRLLQEIRETAASSRREVLPVVRFLERQQDFVAGLGRRVLAGKDLGDLLDYAATAVGGMLGADFSLVLMLSEDRRTLLLSAGRGWRTGVVGRYAQALPGNRSFGPGLSGASPLVLKDLAEDRGYPVADLLKDHMVRSGFLVRMETGRGFFGFLGVFSRAAQTFNEAELDFAAAAGAMLADAIAVKREEAELKRRGEALTAELGEAICGERRRIAEELHDRIGQELAGLGIAFQGLLQELAGRKKATRKALKIAEGIRRTSGKVGALARGLFSPEIEPEELVPSIIRMAENTGRLHGLPVKISLEASVKIPDRRIATQLFCIAQEAVANALRHARAREILVGLRRSGIQLILDVKDDGTGGATLGQDGKGLGLRIMRYRAASIGAALSIVSAPATGTRVACVVPLPGGPDVA
jgi:signal transduction histidine kinase/DNA-binding NarL/FixJ family response regulator